MSSHKYACISKYLEHKHKNLYEILDELCLATSIRPRAQYNGITFLIPSADGIKHLNKLLKEDNLEEAIKIIKCHIINDFLPDAKEWQARATDIPNGLGKQVHIDSVSGSTITLKNGAKIEHDKHFTPIAEHHNNIVYQVTKGTLHPKDFTSDATYKFAKKGSQAPLKKGGFHAYFQEFDINKYVNGTLNSYIGKVLGMGAGIKYENCLIMDLVSYFKYSKHQELLKKIYSPCVITTFLMVMSGHATGDQEEIRNWYYGGRFPVSNATSEYLEISHKSESSNDEHEFDKVTLKNAWKELSETYHKHHPELSVAIVSKLARAHYVEMTCMLPLMHDINAIKEAKIQQSYTYKDMIEVINHIHKSIKDDSMFSNMDQAVFLSMQEHFDAHSFETAVQGSYSDMISLIKNYSLDIEFKPNEHTVQWICHLISKMPNDYKSKIMDSCHHKSAEKEQHEQHEQVKKEEEL